MDKFALLVLLIAKAGKERELEEFLKSAQPLAAREAGTTTWYAVKFGSRDFAIFDTFGSEKDRLAHLAGKVGRALIANTPTLLSGMPKIEHAEVLAFKEAVVETL